MSNNSRILSDDQRILFNYYIRQYNQANAQINHLYTVLSEIRYNIATIYNQSIPSRTSASSSYNLNTLLNSVMLSSMNTHTHLDTANTILSPSQIETSVIRCIFSNISNPINTECPIRLEEFSPTDSVIQIINCGHIFNTRELNTWLLTNNRCPVCRCHILRNTSNNNNIRRDVSDNNTITRDTSNNNTITRDTSNNNTITRDTSNNNTITRDASNNNTSSINLLTQIIDSLFFEYDDNYDASYNNVFTSNVEARFNTRN
jgi:hypothetical protein